MMKLTPYVKLLEMGKEAINKTLAPVRANSAKKKAEYELSKLDERSATLESELHSLCSEDKIDFDRIIDMLDAIALVERRQKQMKKIIAEMFPSGS